MLLSFSREGLRIPSDEIAALASGNGSFEFSRGNALAGTAQEDLLAVRGSGEEPVTVLGRTGNFAAVALNLAFRRPTRTRIQRHKSPSINSAPRPIAANTLSHRYRFVTLPPIPLSSYFFRSRAIPDDMAFMGNLRVYDSPAC